MPSILFVHENYPAQFGSLAQYLVRKGWRVVFATAREEFDADTVHVLESGVEMIRYQFACEPGGVHGYLESTERAILNGQAFARAGSALKKGGFVPDIVVTHSGLGSGSFAKVVWPDTKLIQYLEWWYRYPRVDRAGTLKGRSPEDDHARTLVRNLPFLLDFQQADLVISPTTFQADQAPDFMQEQIVVQHDGIDFRTFHPATPQGRSFTLAGLPDDAPLVTFATRGMEPARGFPTFMAAIAELMEARTDVHVVIAGEDRPHYDDHPPDGGTWKEAALGAHQFDLDRLHFPGTLPKPVYAQLLRRSAAHAYLTRPFVLSWSLIEAMASGAPIVASDVPPVREAISDRSAAKFVPLDDAKATAKALLRCLEKPGQARAMGKRARACARQRYDSAKCHPALEFIFLQLITFEAEEVVEQLRSA